MIVCLGNSIAIAQPSQAFFISIKDEFIGGRMFLLHPTQECRSEIETQIGIVVGHAQDSAHTRKITGVAVSPITVCLDPLIPIWMGIGRELLADDSCMRVLSRRLIKMSMEDQ